MLAAKTQDASPDRRLLKPYETAPLINLLERQGEHMKANSNLPQDVFFANCVWGMCPTPCVEVVATSGKSVFLARRAPNDPYFANTMALAGSVLRKGENLSAVLARALREFEASLFGHPRLITAKVYPTARGDELALIYYAIVEKEQSAFKGRDAGFYPFKNLPRDTLDFHVDMIWTVAEQIGW